MPIRETGSRAQVVPGDVHVVFLEKVEDLELGHRSADKRHRFHAGLFFAGLYGFGDLGQEILSVRKLEGEVSGIE